jgi:hypothetical protein
MADRNLALQLVISARDGASRVIGGLRKGLDAVGRQARAAAAGLAKIGGAVAGIGVAAGGWLIGKLMRDSADDAELLQRQMAVLAQVIETTGGAAGLTAQEIDAMARRLDEATLGSAEGFRAAAAQLLTFKAVGRDSFETVLSLAADLEALGFGSLESQAVALGKALEDPVRGMTALRRSGVSFSAEQQQVIKRLVQTGQAAKAQGMILEAVAGQVAGAASAAGSGLAGLRDLTVKLATDLREQIGAGLLGPLASVQDRINGLLTRLRDTGAAERFGAAVGDAFQRATDAVARWLETLDVDAVVGRFRRLVASIGEVVGDWGTRMEQLRAGTAAAMDGIGRAVEAAKAVWYGFRAAAEAIGIGLAKWFDLYLRGAASTVEALAAVGLASDELALKTRAAQETMADAAQRYAAASIQHWQDAQTAAAAAFAETQQGADDATAAIDAAGEAAGMSADEFDRWRESTEYADAAIANLADHAAQAADATRGGAEAAWEAVAAAQAHAEALEQTDASVDEVVAAWADFEAALIAAERAQRAENAALADGADALDEAAEAAKRLNIQLDSQLAAAAESARQDFLTIAEAGTTSAADVARAWEAYAKQAIASGDATAMSLARQEAAALGLADRYRELTGVKEQSADAGERSAVAAEREAEALERGASAARAKADDQQRGASAQQDAASPQRTETYDFDRTYQVVGSDIRRFRDQNTGLGAEQLDRLTAQYQQYLANRGDGGASERVSSQGMQQASSAAGSGHVRTLRLEVAGRSGNITGDSALLDELERQATVSSLGA